jgi:hypothetical protein
VDEHHGGTGSIGIRQVEIGVAVPFAGGVGDLKDKRLLP